MELLYKEDWVETTERFKTWWAHGYFGRCAIAVHAPRDKPPETPEPPPPRSVEQRWYDLDWISRNVAYQMGRVRYVGEAFPVWSAGYAGCDALPAILGCETRLDMRTGWWEPTLTDPELLDASGLAPLKDSKAYQFAMRRLRRAAAEARGKSIPSIGAFGGSGDTLAGLRGTERLLYDCVERPDAVKAAERRLMDIWCEFYDESYALLKDVSGGSTCWFPLWAPGKFYAAQNDFSFNIGPEMFQELFLPAIRRQTEFLDYSVYHVDGVNAFVHVDALCALPRLNAIQILPGAGKPDPLHYLDVLRKVQAAGKNLHISLPPGRVETALRELSARGLFIQTCAGSEAEAWELLRLAERLSVDRG